MLTEEELAHIEKEERESSLRDEARYIVSEQAKLRYVKYGILPEGTYDWFPRDAKTPANR